jgi:hypothetical protein
MENLLFIDYFNMLQHFLMCIPPASIMLGHALSSGLLADPVHSLALSAVFTLTVFLLCACPNGKRLSSLVIYSSAIPVLYVMAFLFGAPLFQYHLKATDV